MTLQALSQSDVVQISRKNGITMVPTLENLGKGEDMEYLPYHHAKVVKCSLVKISSQKSVQGWWHYAVSLDSSATWLESRGDADPKDRSIALALSIILQFLATICTCVCMTLV